jgi:hypothetical protein
MLHFGTEVTPALMKRLAVFNNGTESFTRYDVQEKQERYGRSIHKFMEEWHWASRTKNHTKNFPEQSYPEPEEWAKYLLETGIDIELRNGPIEQKNVIVDALIGNKLVICNIWIPSKDIPDAEYKHDVLIVGLAKGKLLIHDPLSANLNLRFDTDKAEYTKNKYGSNLEIDCDYFFSEEFNYMKPQPNPYRLEHGYKFLLLSRSIVK